MYISTGCGRKTFPPRSRHDSSEYPYFVVSYKLYQHHVWCVSVYVPHVWALSLETVRTERIIFFNRLKLADVKSWVWWEWKVDNNSSPRKHILRQFSSVFFFFFSECQRIGRTKSCSWNTWTDVWWKKADLHFQSKLGLSCSNFWTVGNCDKILSLLW